MTTFGNRRQLYGNKIYFNFPPPPCSKSNVHHPRLPVDFPIFLACRFGDSKTKEAVEKVALG
jgi:hypothetical protein